MSRNIHQVLRDSKWNEEDASVLVPGDIISIKLGDIIPADARLLQGDPLKIDQVPDLVPYRSNQFVLPSNTDGQCSYVYCVKHWMMLGLV